MKVLIISHNPISTYQNMGKTMLALFDQFESIELCQLYIYPSVPDVKKCDSYFRMTDKDVLSSYYKLRVECGEVNPDENIHKKFIDEQDEKIYNDRRNQNSSRKLARDVMWQCSHWYNKALCDWLDKEKPDCIFLAPGDAKFIYNIALKISKKRNIPIVAYICDDYYFVKKANTVLDRIHQILLHRKMEAILRKTSHIITICDELRDVYSEKFKVPATTIMTGTNYPIAESYAVCSEPHSITYMGNVGLNRNVSLIEIGEVLDEINAELNTDYSLKIYTSTKAPEIISAFEKVKSIRLCGYVSGEEFDKVFHSSELLLHTEGFTADSIDRVKHSVSTKIADSLGSGIPLIAYGPECVSSMRHLIRNEAAITITNKKELKYSLMKTFSDADMRNVIVQKALVGARNYHISNINSNRLYKVLKKCDNSMDKITGRSYK